MDMALPLEAREVLFHLNYMGYRNISKEQLKGFMIDLKKLIRFEANPQGPQASRGKSQSIPLAATNIERLFESRTRKASLQKQQQQHSNNHVQYTEKSTEATREDKNKLTTDVHNQENKNQQVSHSATVKPSSADKENIPRNNKTSSNQGKETVKPKMWIRPQSAQTNRSANIKKRTDPVALYQEYQKDWDRFKNNICESSRSDLRWQIREKMANRQT